jgi:peroxin-16
VGDNDGTTLEHGKRDWVILMPPVYALLSLVSSYHDTVLSRRLTPALSLPPHPFARAPAAPSSKATADAQPEGSAQSRPTPQAPPRISPVLPPPSDHTRYTRYWSDHSIIYRKASRALSVLGYVELLVEMLARKRGDRARWRVIVSIEGIK